jgi:hypothetical protein
VTPSTHVAVMAIGMTFVLLVRKMNPAHTIGFTESMN